MASKKTIWDLSLEIAGKDTGAKQAIRTVKHQLDDLKGAADQLGKDWKNFTGNATKLAKGVAIGVAAAGTGIALVGREVLSVGMEFEQGMANVQAISGATGEDFDMLSRKAADLGASTKFTALEATEALSYMAMAGWKTADMLGGIDGIMSLAAASGEDLAMVSDIVTDSLTAFGLKAEDSGRFADMLAAAASNANTNVSMLGESFKSVAPVAGSMGYSVKDVTTALGLMANAGIKGGEAGTSLRSVLTRLAKPTKEVSHAFEALNFSAVNADGSMKPLNELIPELRERFSGLTAEEKGAYATMIAGKNAMSGFLAMVSAGEEDFNLLANAISNSSGAAQTMADIKLDTLQGKITLLQSQFDGVKLAIFNGLGSSNFKNALGAISDQITAAMPAITEMSEKIGEWLGGLVQRLPEIIQGIKDFGSWVKDTVTGVKDFVGGWKNLGKILAGLAIAPTLISGLQVVFSLGGLINTAMKNMPIIMAKIGLAAGPISGALLPIIGIIAGIAAVIYTVVRNFDNLKQYALDCIERIKSAFGGATGGMAVDWQKVGEVAKNVLGVIMSILESGVLYVIKSVMNTITSGIQIAIGMFGVLWNVVKLIFWPLETIIKVIAGFIKGGFSGALEALGGQFGKLGDIITGIFGGIKVIFGGVIGFFKGRFEIAIELIKRLFGSFGVDIGNVFTNIKSFITGATDWFKNGFNNAVNFVKGLPGNVSNAFGTAVEFIKNVFQAGFDFVNKIIGGLPEPFQKVFAGIKIIIDGFIGFWKNVFSSAINAIKNIVTLLPNLFTDPIGTIKEKIEGFVNFFKDKIAAVKDFFGGIGEKIGNLFGKGRTVDVAAHAEGGIFTHRHIAEIAEKGAEAVVPLNKSPHGFNLWKQAGELGGYLKTASEQSPAISAAVSVSATTPPVKVPESSPIMAAASQRISSGGAVVNIEFKMTNNFSGGTPDSTTASQISEAGQKAGEDFESKVRSVFESIMRDRMRVSYG